MKSFQIILLLCTLSVFIVPTIQYGTIFTDYIKTPVNFTDITETYISGIKSKTAASNEASVETITATNPDGFYVNSPGPLNGNADTNVEMTAAQEIVFGSLNTTSTSVQSGGSFSVVNDRTDIDSTTLTFQTGNTLSFTSLGPLTLQGSNIDLSTNETGLVYGRDVTISSATYSEFEGADILLNTTNGADFISQNGDMDFKVSSIASFTANFVNMESRSGVDMHSTGDVYIGAYAIVDLTAAQFAQFTADTDASVEVPLGDIEVYAATTAAFATGGAFTVNSAGDIDLHSFGDSESEIQFLSEAMTINANNTAIGTLVASYDVDIISAANITSTQSVSTFVADNYVSFVAGDDFQISSNEVNFQGTDFQSSSYGDSTVRAANGVQLTTSELFETSSQYLVLGTTDNISVTSSEFSLLQKLPAVLSRSETQNFDLNTDSFTVTSETTQFTTIGDFVLSAQSSNIIAQNIDIRSSNGPNDIQFTYDNSTTVTATDDITYKTSYLLIEPSTDYNTTSDSLNFETVHSIQYTSNSDTTVRGSTSSLSSEATTLIKAVNGQANFLSSNSFTQNTYNTDLKSLSEVQFVANDQVVVGAYEYIDVSAVSSLEFTTGDAFVSSSSQTTNFEATLSDFFINGLMNIASDDTIYFKASLPTDTLSLSTNILSFNGETTFNSGNNININVDGSADFSGTNANLNGYDSVSFGQTEFNATASTQATISSNGPVSLTAKFTNFDAGTNGNIIMSGDQLNSVASFIDTRFTLSTTTTVYSGRNYTLSASDASISTGDAAYNFASHYTVESADQIVNQNNGDTTITASSAHYTALKNIFQSGKAGGIQINATSGDITGLANFFSSSATNSFSSNQTWLLGGSLQTTSDTVTFDLSATGSFYSDDVLNFNVNDTILLSSSQLIFEIPLDGSLLLQGDVLEVTSSSVNPFILTSYGATTVSAGNFIFDSATNTNFEESTFYMNFGGTLTLNSTATADDITFFAHEGEVNIATSVYSSSSTTASYLASRDINIQGSAVQFVSSAQGSPVTVTLNALNATTSSPSFGILAETIGQDSNIVFDSFAGIYGAINGSCFINTNGLQSIVGSYGIQTNSTNSTTFQVNGMGDWYSAGDFSNIAGRDYLLTAHSISLQSLQAVNFANYLQADPGSLTMSFEIQANQMIVSTAQNGPVQFSSSSNLTFTTTGAQSYVVADTAVSSSNVASYTSTSGNIVSLTSAGAYSEYFVDYTATAGTNISFVSGHDATFSSGDATYTAGTDFFALSLDGRIDFDTATDATYSAGGKILIDSEGERTVPRDGVFLGGNIVTSSVSPGGSSTYLYAKKAVTFGEFTRPGVEYYVGGSFTENGFTLTSDGDIYTNAAGSTNYASIAQVTETSSQGTFYESGASMVIRSTGAFSTPANVLISSVTGNVHMHSHLDSDWQSQGQLQATSSTGFISFTTLGQASFTADQRILLKSNSLTYSEDNFYSTVAQNTISFDGHTYFDVTTAAGSQGSINFAGTDIFYRSRENLNIYSYGDDGKLGFNAGSQISILTPKTGDITLTSAASFDIYAASLNEASNGKISISSLTNIGGDSSEGIISFISESSFSLSATDKIDFSAGGDATLSGEDLIDISATGDFTFNTYYDQEWSFGSKASVPSVSFLAGKSIIIENSPDAGGDVSFSSAGIYDALAFIAQSDIIQNIGGDQHVHTVDGFKLITTGTDFKDGFGVRFQTDGSANISIQSGASSTFRSKSNTKFDASQDLDMLAGLGLQLTGLGVNFDNEGILFVATEGDILFKTLQSPIFFAGSQINVVGNGTDTNQGMIKLISNGIDDGSEYGVRFSFESASAVIGSVNGNLEVEAQKSVEFHLDYQGAHAAFGFQRNKYIDVHGPPYYYYDPYSPYIPSNSLKVPLNSQTKLIASAVDADIVFDTQITEDGIGYFIAFAGTLEPVGFSGVNAPSQLHITSYGDGNVQGDINFRQESGLTFKGYDSFGGTEPVQSDILFIANDHSSDIEIRTTEESVLSNINVVSIETEIGSEQKLYIQSNNRKGGSNVEFTASDTISITTTGASWGPGTALPGIEFRGHQKEIIFDAGPGDIITHSLRDMYVTADSGIDFYSENTINFRAGNGNSEGTVLLHSVGGPITFQYDTVVVTSDDIDITSYSLGQEIYEDAGYDGTDVNIIADTIDISSDEINFFQAYGGDINFNFNSEAYFYNSNSNVNGGIFINGYLSLPMYDTIVVTGTSCSSLTGATAEIFIARSPPYDQYDARVDNVLPEDVYGGLGLRVCACDADIGILKCMALSQFSV